MAGLDQRGVGSGIQPRKAAAEHFDEQIAALHIDPVHIGDFDFAAGRGFQVGGNPQHIVVIEIQAGDGDVGFRVGRLFLDRDAAALMIEFDDAVLLGRGDGIAEHGCALGARAGPRQLVGKAVTVKDVVAEHEGHPVGSDKVGTHHKGVRQAARLFLRHISKFKAKIAAVAQQPLKQMLVRWRRDDQDVANAGKHQR